MKLFDNIKILSSKSRKAFQYCHCVGIYEGKFEFGIFTMFCQHLIFGAKKKQILKCRGCEEKNHGKAKKFVEINFYLGILGLVEFQAN